MTAIDDSRGESPIADTLDLDALERLAAATTKGPWTYGPVSSEDEAFVRAARTALPALVAEVRRLRAQIANPYLDRPGCTCGGAYCRVCDLGLEPGT